MNIYVSHSRAFDYENELYAPLQASSLIQNCNLVFPHLTNGEPFNSKGFFINGCDLVIGEVSYPATGSGIELGWAEILGLPIICFYKKGTKPPGSAYVITQEVYEYATIDELVQIVEDRILQIKQRAGA